MSLKANVGDPSISPVLNLKRHRRAAMINSAYYTKHPSHHHYLWWTVIVLVCILNSLHTVNAALIPSRRRGIRGERFLDEPQGKNNPTNAPTKTPSQSPPHHHTNVCKEAQTCEECETKALRQEHDTKSEDEPTTCRWRDVEGKEPSCRRVVELGAVDLDGMCVASTPQSAPPAKAPTKASGAGDDPITSAPTQISAGGTVTVAPTKDPTDTSPNGADDTPASPSPSNPLSAPPTKEQQPSPKNPSPTDKPTEENQPTKAPISLPPTMKPVEDETTMSPTKAPTEDTVPADTPQPTAQPVPGPPADDAPTTAQPTVRPTKAPTKSFNNNDEQDYYDTEGSPLDSFGSKEAAGITVLVVLLFLWNRCCRGNNSNNYSQDAKSGMPTRSSPNASVFGQRNNEAQYQGVATKEEVDDDENADDWGWDDEDNDDSFAGDMELSNVATARKVSTPPSYKKSSPTNYKTTPMQSSSPAFAQNPQTSSYNNNTTTTSPARMVAGGGGGRSTTVLPSSSPMKMASLPTYVKKKPPPKKPPAPKADDIFSEMGLSVKPTFSKVQPVKSLGATKLPVDDSWGDDDDLDDLLDD